MNELHLPESQCKCKVCKAMCINPCYGTPEEMQRIMDAGFGWGLETVAYQETDESPTVRVIAPKTKELGNKCIFFQNNGDCQLHDLGLKPIEGRVSNCAMNPVIAHAVRPAVVMKWLKPKAHRMVTRLAKKELKHGGAQ